MATDAQNHPVMFMHQLLEPALADVASALVDDPEAAAADAVRRLEEMAHSLAYADEPTHPMAMPLFTCAVNLALYLAVRERGADVHDFGRAVHDAFVAFPFPDLDPGQVLPELTTAGEASRRSPKLGQFVFDVVPEGADYDYGVNITSCGICHLFAKYDAMDLVPYMCALDDLMSDRSGDGLRRTGTIALGAHQCDFRYQKGGEPLRLADQYGERVQLRRRPSTQG